jgi:chromosome segregation ATPase
LVAVLLVATIVYAVLLNRKLTALRNVKGEMEAVIASFAEATAQAENGIQTLKVHATESGTSLDNTVNRAHGLADDLSFLIERGNSLADRLEGILERGRGGSAGTVRPNRPQSARAQATPKAPQPVAEVSPQEVALLNSLRGVR